MKNIGRIAGQRVTAVGRMSILDTGDEGKRATGLTLMEKKKPAT